MAAKTQRTQRVLLFFVGATLVANNPSERGELAAEAAATEVGRDKASPLPTFHLCRPVICLNKIYNIGNRVYLASKNSMHCLRVLRVFVAFALNDMYIYV